VIPDFELRALLRTDTRDQGKVVVGAALFVALLKPAADIAVLARLRIGVGSTFD